MLTVRYEQGDKVEQIYKSLTLTEKPSGTNFVMYDDGVPVALWRMHALSDGKVWLIDRVKFLPAVERDDKLFFVHAVFYKLQEGAPVILRFEGEHNELECFGFEIVDGNMQICSKDINLYYACVGKG